ncbi:hypothetical protein DR62_05985 [Burkholderia thailandensis]|nr:hypothetical protein DR62_05985 [Burkholderia thailandensis]AOI50689.1 hypothetical protein WI24_02015 [Burkholderia thailandensis]
MRLIVFGKRQTWALKFQYGKGAITVVDDDIGASLHRFSSPVHLKPIATEGDLEAGLMSKISCPWEHMA